MSEVSKWKVENGKLINIENTTWIEYNFPLRNINPLWNIQNNQMINPLNTIWITEYMTPKYPNIFWEINQDKQMEHNNKVWITEYMTPKYPNIFWNIQSNNELEHNNKDWINDYMTPIYPNIFWIIENNNMERNQLFNYEFLGSFYNSMLLNIVISSTVRKIGERAFYNTQLSTVTIPTNCEYSKNSFPIGCKINVK